MGKRIYMCNILGTFSTKLKGLPQKKVILCILFFADCLMCQHEILIKGFK